MKKNKKLWSIYLPSLDSLSSLLSDVRIDFALLVVLVFFDTELKLEGTGEGVLLTDAGLDVDCTDGVGFPVEDVPSLGVGVELLPFWVGASALPFALSVLVFSSWFFRDLWGLFWDCNLIPSVIEFTNEACECDMLSLAKTRSWWASYSSLLGYILDINKSKLGSGLRDRFDTNFFRHVGHSLFPERNAVMIQSLQNLCRHSFVVIVFLSISKHIGHINSLCKLRGDTAISVASVITSCEVRWSS